VFDLTVELIALGLIIGAYFNGFRFFLKKLWMLCGRIEKAFQSKIKGP
jgi:hypothetical protein